MLFNSRIEIFEGSLYDSFNLIIFCSTYFDRYDVERICAIGNRREIFNYLIKVLHIAFSADFGEIGNFHRGHFIDLVADGNESIHMIRPII